MEQYDLTEAQKKAFAENEADFRKFDDQLRDVREAARARLRGSGWDPGPGSEDAIRCLSCPCPDFQAGGPQGKCKRASCRHFLIDHDLPI
ncbi:hypothetical protein [Streptomyces neyagawaensis]|uniref:hypothetical protein n=1 Tax=Streptomyces neyagawaensis TaxID=42238 RepID=UPI0006E2A758|nr:hypothetical protein [Streptomyces neyagawaensis]MCL6736852.1 hypothetical protein [Streptomyces neyagawaensis]MDE1684617.1 hypothetical protein [Streptomyces neyagawaensis]